MQEEEKKFMLNIMDKTLHPPRQQKKKKKKLACYYIVKFNLINCNSIL